MWQQINQRNTAKQTSIAPLFWDGIINTFTLIKPEQGKQGVKTFNILYLWKTNYTMGKAKVYVGIARRYNGTKWRLLHTIDPDVDASRDAVLLSLQQNMAIQKSCKEPFVPAMVGQYLLQESFFTCGELVAINLLNSPLSRDVFCTAKRVIEEVSKP